MCCHYEDPTWYIKILNIYRFLNPHFRRLIHEKATHVELKTKYVQNSNYFEKYIDDLMEHFEFSEEVKMQGDKLIQKYNM